jgi:predicted membrane chloride channel (bestrophin family)
MLVSDDCRLSSCDDLLNRVNVLLADCYRITHSTIQFEYECCGRHEGARVFCTQAAHDREASSCAHQRERRDA